MVAFVESAPHVDLLIDHGFGTAPQLWKGEFQGESVLAIEFVAIHLVHLPDGEPQRFAWNRARVRAAAADSRLPLDHGHAQAVLDRLHRRSFAPGTGANYHDVVS